MNILVINWQDITNPLGGGAETHFHEIFRRIAALGHSVTLLCCHYPGAAAEEVLDGIRIIRRGSRSLFNYYVPFVYRQLRRSQHFDLVIDDVNKIPFYTPLYVREPLMGISHHFFGTSIYRETNVLAGSYVYLAEKLVDFIYTKTPFAVVSQSTKDELIERGFDPHKLRIIPNALTHEAFPMKVGEKSPVPMIVYFGRIKKYKSPDHLLQAFIGVLQQHPNAQLHFAGAGDFLPHLQELARQAGIEKALHFWGRVSEEQKRDLLTRAWCVVNTSMKEGWGITNLEANACGTPVISADVPGLRDSVKPGSSGLLYPYGDISALGSAILSLVEQDALRAQLSHGAIEWAREFSWDESARSMLDFCRELAGT